MSSAYLSQHVCGVKAKSQNLSYNYQGMQSLNARNCWLRQERRPVKNARRLGVNREFKDLAERKIRRIP